MSPDRKTDGYIPNGWDFVDGDQFVSECLRPIWSVRKRGKKEVKKQLTVNCTEQALDCPHLVVVFDGPICNYRGTMVLKRGQGLHEFCVIYPFLDEET